MKYKKGDKVIVTIYQTQGVIVDIFNEKKKMYRVAIENHVIIIGEDGLENV